MFTAITKSKTKTERGLEFVVEFSDGIETFERLIVPQDNEGLKHAVKGELARLNAAPELDAKYEVGAELNFSEPEKVLTKKEKYQIARFELMDYKTDLDLGLITQAEYDAELAKVSALKAAITK